MTDILRKIEARAMAAPYPALYFGMLAVVAAVQLAAHALGWL